MKNLFAFRIAPELKTKLEDKANELNLPQSWVINEALRAYLGHDQAPVSIPTPDKPKQPVKQAEKGSGTMYKDSDGKWKFR